MARMEFEKFVDLQTWPGSMYYSDRRWWPLRLLHWLGRYDPVADAIRWAQYEETRERPTFEKAMENVRAIR